MGAPLKIGAKVWAPVEGAPQGRLPAVVIDVHDECYNGPGPEAVIWAPVMVRLIPFGTIATVDALAIEARA